MINNNNNNNNSNNNNVAINKDTLCEMLRLQCERIYKKHISRLIFVEMSVL